MLKKRHKSWGLWGGGKRGMHTQNMDTIEGPPSPTGEAVNGAAVITPSFSTASLSNAKVSPSCATSQVAIENQAVKDAPASCPAPQEGPPPGPAFQSFPFAFSSTPAPMPAACASPNNIYIPHNLENQGQQVQISVPNSFLPQISAMFYKQEQFNQQHNVPFIPTSASHIASHQAANSMMCLPMTSSSSHTFTQAPPLKEASAQGPFKPFPNNNPPSVVSGHPVTAINALPASLLHGTNGVLTSTSHPLLFPPSKSVNAFPKIIEEEPMDVRTNPVKLSLATVVENGALESKSNDNHDSMEEQTSETDMEVKSMDLTFRVNIVVPDKKERERPMSWDGELSDSENIPTKQTAEEHMRIEEEVEPMSPMSTHSDPDQEPLPAQVKSENQVEDHNFSTQCLHQTESPVPARSDSGCELHVGPFTPSQSPLLPRLHAHAHSPTHLYSPTQSPSQSRHLSGFSSPYSHSPSTGLSRNSSDASQYGGSYTSYSSAPSPISPTHYSPSQSPNLGRVAGHFASGQTNHGAYGGMPLDLREPSLGLGGHHDCAKELKDDDRLSSDLAQHSVLTAQSGITRQQLINSPCPICSDKISGFHYGIFSCESCKGFFKRTVQNKKNYVCMRGANCGITISTRKKCPACRFDKCLRKGMKLEAIREDRTRGGRSTYQCAPYTLSPPLVSPSSSGTGLDQVRISDCASVKSEPQEGEDAKPSSSKELPAVPLLLQQIHKVEHLWHCSEDEISTLRQAEIMARDAMDSEQADCETSICKFSENRLYKLVKWCKSLPLLRHISIDDRIVLLMNSYWELVLLSCCFRSAGSPGEIRVTSGKTIDQSQADAMGIGPCVYKMLNLASQLRRLQVDRYEYMAMKVIVLLTSDVTGLSEREKVRSSQERVLQALQEYTLSYYPQMPCKFGELLLRIPELERTCHLSKEMLSVKKKQGDVHSSDFLFELLKSDL